MAGSFSDYMENAILDHILKTTAYTPATNIYVALYTVAPTDAGGGTEVSGGSYARVTCNVWDAASGGSASNTNTVTFAQATANWGTLVAFATFDALTGGNMLGWGDLDTNKAINNGDTADFAAGALVVTLD